MLATAAAALTTLAGAQDTRTLPSVSIAGTGLVHSAAGSTSQNQRRVPPSTHYYSFCPKRTCLYYAGDFDTNSRNFNALTDYDNPGNGITDVEVWVGIKPTTDVTITGASGNYLTNNAQVGINPTPFLVRTGVSAGNGGKLVCTSGGDAALSFWQIQGDFYAVNYYIAKLTKPCHLKAGKKYYVDLTPQYNDSSTFGYLMDEEDHPPLNHVGWHNDLDDSYFNSTTYGAVYEPTWGSSGACSGFGCDEFSIALTGKKSK